MSAQWALTYVKTAADPQAVLGAVRAVLRTQVDGTLVTQTRGVSLTYPSHEYAPVGADFDHAALYERPQPALLLFPPKNDLFTLGWIYFFSPVSIMMSDRDSRAHTARLIHKAQAAGESSGAAEMAAVVFPDVMRDLSRRLEAEIAFVLFLRNPAVDVTAIQFFRQGEAVTEYFCRLYDGQADRVDLPAPDALRDLFDGRFQFVSAPQVADEEGYVRRFSAEDFGRAEINPAYTTYTPAESRLFVPFWIDGFKPFGIVTYDFDALFERRYVNGTAPQPVIHEVSPACVLRSHRDPARRTLALVGEHFPIIHHGLQFLRPDSGELSIIFDMEVHWIGTTRIAVDMARLKTMLWPDPRVVLHVRMMDTENASYRAISDWSSAFVLADNERSC